MMTWWGGGGGGGGGVEKRYVFISCEIVNEYKNFFQP